MNSQASSKTLSQKLYDSHVVSSREDGADLLYIDRHFIHEMSSVPAFARLKERGRTVRRPELTVATEDHIVPTSGLAFSAYEANTRRIFELFRRGCDEWSIRRFSIGAAERGIVHVIGPELGLTLPGTTVVCGDSHTSTHGALGALAFGIGTSEVEHVLATQMLVQRRPRATAVNYSGDLRKGVVAKDLILHTIGVIGTSGGTGSIIEYRGDTIRQLSIEERMTVCNMSIEAGARAGLVAPDDLTFEYLEDRLFTPKDDSWTEALAAWRALRTDEGATFDVEYHIELDEVEPHVTWGTKPSQVVPLSGTVPAADEFSEESEREAAQRALEYQGLVPGLAVRDIQIDAVFIGSCTNGRIEDLRAAASVLDGRRIHPDVRGLVVPGSESVKRQAEQEGLARIFMGAGLRWGEASCSMCAGMTSDVFEPGTRCISTSNRNFEGRQGPGVRTHLASPWVAAASAITGTIGGEGR